MHKFTAMIFLAMFFFVSGSAEAQDLGTQRVRQRLNDAAQQMKQLRKSGDTSAETLETAKPVMAEAEAAFNELMTTYRKQVDLMPGGFLSAKHDLNSTRENFDYIKTHSDTTRVAADNAQQDKYAAKVKDIQSLYQQQEPTGELHKKNVGRIVWSTKRINKGDQDSIEIRNTFKLTDPIFGRLYLAHSLGNTPVYSSDGGRPSENYQFWCEFRLFINGQEKPEKTAPFMGDRLKGKSGETWTTWQFAPNPVPFDTVFQKEADAWRRITSDLSPGTHKVRFELWGVQGQFRSRQAIAVGEFSLVVGEGDRVAAGAKFPDETYSGGDLKQIRGQIKKALVGPVTKSVNQILDIAVTGNWSYGRYTETKIRYRKIRGAVLWKDTDNDKVCRYHTYTFLSDEAGGGWAPLKYRSFGSPEGEVECP